MDIREYNKQAWDRKVTTKDQWTIPVSSEDMQRARSDDWSVLVTPKKKVPKKWFGKLSGARILCLASGGGQQGPLLAAAGAKVTVFDNSPNQLAQDRMVADRDGLEIETIEGDMRDLSGFKDEAFDLVFHPCSNCFIDNVQLVWGECSRVLRRGGILIAGFSNPIIYLFDPKKEREGVLQARFKIPYSDLTSLSEAERMELYPDDALTFGHSLQDLIGGQILAGFVIDGFFEDNFGGSIPLDNYIDSFIATRALKL